MMLNRFWMTTCLQVRGEVEFRDMKLFAGESIIKVFEPAQDVTPADLKKSLDFVRNAWA